LAELDPRADGLPREAAVVDRESAATRPKREKGVIEVAAWIETGPRKRHGRGRSLWPQVTEAGTASWPIRYRHDGKARTRGRGPVPRGRAHS
jgi:hypothetical protein